MGSIQDQLAEVREQVASAVKAVDTLAEAVESDASQGNTGLDAQNDPEVQRAAVALAKAIARAQGYDAPLQVADGDFGSLPVMILPEEFAKFGGIGIGVMVAPPTDAALNG